MRVSGAAPGSGAAPVIAQLARETGALVIVFATLPFGFEGKRRSTQAQEAMARLNEIANAVICFENDRMGDMVAPKAGIHQAFAVADMIDQPKRALDCEFDPAAGNDSNRVRRFACCTARPFRPLRVWFR